MKGCGLQVLTEEDNDPGGEFGDVYAGSVSDVLLAGLGLHD